MRELLRLLSERLWVRVPLGPNGTVAQLAERFMLSQFFSSFCKIEQEAAVREELLRT